MATNAHRFAFYDVELFLLETVENGIATIEAVISPTIHSVAEDPAEFWRILLASKQEMNLRASCRDTELSALASVQLLLDGYPKAVVVPLIPLCTVISGMSAFAIEDPGTKRYIARNLVGLQTLISAFMALYRKLDPEGRMRMEGQAPMTPEMVERIRAELFRQSTSNEFENMTMVERVAAMEPMVKNMGHIVQQMEDLYHCWVVQFGSDPTAAQQTELRKRRIELDNRRQQHQHALEVLTSVKIRV